MGATCGEFADILDSGEKLVKFITNLLQPLDDGRATLVGFKRTRPHHDYHSILQNQYCFCRSKDQRKAYRNQATGQAGGYCRVLCRVQHLLPYTSPHEKLPNHSCFIAGFVTIISLIFSMTLRYFSSSSNFATLLPDRTTVLLLFALLLSL